MFNFIDNWIREFLNTKLLLMQMTRIHPEADELIVLYFPEATQEELDGLYAVLSQRFGDKTILVVNEPVEVFKAKINKPTVV